MVTEGYKKRILLVSQYFYPESFKGNDIAFELAKRGYKVDVLCGIPNYPIGKYTDGYGILKKRKEIINGVSVFRVFQFPRGKSNKFMMFLNYISYPFCACLYVLFFFVWKNYDAVFVQQLSPIFQALPAVLLKKLKRIPLYMWVLDIWPDALKSAAGVKNPKILDAVNAVVKIVYNNCDKILISSRRFEPLIVSKGNYKDKIIYFPNWSEDILKMPQDYDIPKLPEGFRIMIAGNLGKSQNLEAVTEVMLGLKDVPEVKWIFVGDGSRKEWLEQFIQDNGLTDRAVCVGRYPFKAMSAFFSQANALLMTLRAGFPHLEAVVPARLQSYMSAGRPVLAMIGCGGADIINESQCGFAVPAGDSITLIDVIRKRVLTDKMAFEQMGANGRAYFNKNYRMDMCMDNLEKILNKKKSIWANKRN